MTESYNCTFCGIAEGRFPASKILESDRIIAFTSLDGGYPLIAPKLHIQDWTDSNLDEEMARELGLVQRNLARVVMEIHGGGISIVSNNGRESGQEIPHLHTHIMPRKAGDGLIRFARGDRLIRAQLDERALGYKTRLQQLGLV